MSPLPFGQRTAAAALLLLTVASLPVASASAQALQEHLRACTEAGEPGRRVAGCTALIQSGGLDQRTLAAIRHLRGVAHQERGQIGEAIADFSEARRLDPSEAAPVAGLALILASLNQRCLGGSGEDGRAGCSLLLEHGETLGIDASLRTRAEARLRETSQATAAPVPPPAPTATVVVPAQPAPAAPPASEPRAATLDQAPVSPPGVATAPQQPARAAAAAPPAAPAPAIATPVAPAGKPRHAFAAKRGAQCRPTRAAWAGRNRVW